MRLPRVFGRRRESPRCASLEKAQNAAGKDTAIAPLTAAQFHFLQGVYVLHPTMPDGLPPGDGTLLLNRDHGDDGLILWTLGPLVCEPMPAPKKLIDYLAQVKSGADGNACDGCREVDRCAAMRTRDGSKLLDNLAIRCLEEAQSTSGRLQVLWSLRSD